MAGEAEGFTLIEALVALLVLSFVFTSSLLVFFERQNRLAFADQTTRAWQAIAAEAEARRYTPFDSLQEGEILPFRIETSILKGMSASTSVEVIEESPRLKKLILRVEWGEGRRARVEVLRGRNELGELW